MNFQLKGILTEIFDTQHISDKFSKREFVVETKYGDYTETIKFQLTNDKCDILDTYAVGEEVNVHFNIKGRKWEKDGKTSYFINLEAWRLESVSAPKEDGVDDIPESTDDLPY